MDVSTGLVQGFLGLDPVRAGAELTVPAGARPGRAGPATGRRARFQDPARPLGDVAGVGRRSPSGEAFGRRVESMPPDAPWSKTRALVLGRRCQGSALPVR